MAGAPSRFGSAAQGRSSEASTERHELRDVRLHSCDGLLSLWLGSLRQKGHVSSTAVQRTSAMARPPTPSLGHDIRRVRPDARRAGRREVQNELAMWFAGHETKASGLVQGQASKK